MCDPVSLGAASLAISTAATGASFYAKSQQAEARNEAAEQAAIQKYNTQNTRLRQEQEAATREKLRLEKQSAEKQATAKVAAGEANVTGNSVESLMADFERQEADYKSVMNRNMDMKTLQVKQSMEGINNNAKNRMTSGPSGVGAALSVAGDAVGTYANNQEAFNKELGISDTNNATSATGTVNTRTGARYKS